MHMIFSRPKFRCALDYAPNFKYMSSLVYLTVDEMQFDHFAFIFTSYLLTQKLLWEENKSCLNPRKVKTLK